MHESPLTGTSYRAYRNARDKRRIAKASGPCCLCGRAGGLPIVVDHCHGCGIIRGELCGKCNNRMHFADQAANDFPLYTADWLRQVNAILSAAGKAPVTLAQEIDWAIGWLRDFLTEIGAAQVFAYQSQCSCPPITQLT